MGLMMKTEVEQGVTARDPHCLSVSTSEWTHEDTHGGDFACHTSALLEMNGVMYGALSLALQEETGSLRGWAEHFSVRHTDAREVYRTPRVRAQGKASECVSQEERRSERRLGTPAR